TAAWDSALSRHLGPLDSPRYLGLNAFDLLRGEELSPDERAPQVVAVPLAAHDTCLRVAGGAEEERAGRLGHCATRGDRNLCRVPIHVASEVFDATVEDAGQSGAFSEAEHRFAKSDVRGVERGRTRRNSVAPLNRPAAVPVRLLGRGP